MQIKIDDGGGKESHEVDRVVLEASTLAPTPESAMAGVPSEILIAPAGEIRSSSGSFLVDDEAMAATIAAFEAHGTDLPIDYEHQTLGGPYSSPTGQAPAAGWITNLRQVSASEAGPRGDGAELQPGLWAEVSWTDVRASALGAVVHRSPIRYCRLQSY